MAPNPLSLVAQKLQPSPSYARRAYFQSLDKFSCLSQRGAYAFVILCLLTVMEHPVFSVHVSFHLAAIRASSPFLHSPSHCMNQRNSSSELRGPSGFLGRASPQETPCSNLFKPTDCTSTLRSAVSSCLLPLCAHAWSPADIQKPASWPPSPLQCCSLLGVTPSLPAHPPRRLTLTCRLSVWGWNFVVAWRGSGSGQPSNSQSVQKHTRHLALTSATDNPRWRGCTECHLDKDRSRSLSLPAHTRLAICLPRSSARWLGS